MNLLMLRERAAQKRRDVPDDFGLGQDEYVYGGIISAVIFPGIPFADAFFGCITTDRDDNREPHLTGENGSENTMKTGAKTQHKFAFSPETFPCKRSLSLLTLGFTTNMLS